MLALTFFVAPSPEETHCLDYSPKLVRIASHHRHWECSHGCAFMSKNACKLWCTRSVRMPTASTTSHTFILGSSNVIQYILWIIAGQMTSFGRSERSASLVSVRPQRNSVKHFLTINWWCTVLILFIRLCHGFRYIFSFKIYEILYFH